MLTLSELSTVIWNEKDVPNNIKKDWAALCNSRFMPSTSKYPWTGADILDQKNAQVSWLLQSIKPYKYAWASDMEYYLKMWKGEIDQLVSGLPKN